MKAIIITQPGGPEVLQIEERPTPAYASTEALIKVMAAGINRPDVAQRKGNYPPPAGAPVDIPGLEIAGVVAEVGSDVTRWKVGDKVCALVIGGGYAEYCNAPEGQCLPIPDNLSFAEAAALPETFFTVWSNVFDRAKLQPGESLLVHGGSSGIGVAAIQMATALGSKVYVTAGSDEKCKFCEDVGAAKAINYNKENFSDAIAGLTDGKGVDVILDMIGGAYTSLNIKSLATEGRLVLINTMKGKTVEVDLSEVMRKRINITGSMLRSRDVGFKAAIAQKLEEYIWPLLASGKIKPVVYKAFTADEAAKAHELMESSEHMGKIVLRFEESL
ncbi:MULTISPECIES: NAD(P)H-quinone oxidoreductase [unclassified Mucilaginibacter]|uniref:NAD(P)H-quinone oxidoreductase n=1 Tax=unclassified Mucilaginibacter TaxID=2617802 RepID=UPI002AC9977A|nr:MULTISPECIES: NAD(P)H-quinone oxidoreductase [unclassified Mucilaginibacter]MEB0248896.1 NAD(P)H-quinone oxidoreductase [Mucilaginibacter sp. 5B2]MEB0264055.1 NAD(P)H-quinone oxidoreductase [Mucilaginibacter sp. 10I4]MEB0277498.1 NAD(P)H-quinone oxidoreductase [Mucilaginibacter sp. 10B2]MEB0302736.1 NAD(P)H-quinone oxidoreductase [Mucilaginibacter sp. 5C4]WPX24872.1 NAD(P)H-quinone oxidoreductase [Mucilaginibacter sp. 5C4]